METDPHYPGGERRPGVLALAGTTHGAGPYATVDYPPSTDENELQVGVTYTLWIPEGVKTLRGVIVHQHGKAGCHGLQGRRHRCL